MVQSEEFDERYVKDLRFELAWRWFALHSSQRISMFNFFLVSAGVLTNAYVVRMIYEWFLLGGALGIVAAVVSLSFVFLDMRNISW
jgi:hypothetical protein